MESDEDERSERKVGKKIVIPSSTLPSFLSSFPPFLSFPSLFLSFGFFLFRPFLFSFSQILSEKKETLPLLRLPPFPPDTVRRTKKKAIVFLYSVEP
jgi:hypothetical protein